MRLLLPLLALALLGAAPPPPLFPPGTETTVLHGISTPDPYRALENPADPRVMTWSDAETARTRAYLDTLPGRAALASRLRAMLTAASPSVRDVQAAGGAVFALYADPARQQPLLVRYDTALTPKSRVTVLDPNALDPSGHTEIDWFVAAPDGAHVAVSLSRNGSEDGTLHILNTVTGKETEAPIPRVQYPTAGGSLAWAATGTEFWYTRYPGADAPPAERHFNQQVFWHVLRTDWRQDKLALGTEDGLPRTAEVFLDNRDEAGAAVALVQLGDGGQYQGFVLRPSQKPLRVATYDDRIVGVALARDGTLFGVSRSASPMGSVRVLAPPYTGGFAAAPTLVAADPEAAIIDGGELGSPLTVAGPRLLVTRIAGGPMQLLAFDRAGHGARLETPPVASIDGVTALPGGSVLYRVGTFTEPPYFARGSPSGGAVRTALQQTSPVSFADVSVTRVFATSRDGTKVPMTILARKGTRLDGNNPVLMYGYGGFGISETPHFGGPLVRLWLDAGGVYVDTNIRGGGEYGAAWHEAGMLTRKQNDFDDFYACGQWLIAHRYTRPGRLALLGGSNGGLLMGAMVTQHPDLARAVVSDVGIYDMLRLERDPNGAFNVTEYGTVADPAQFRALLAYSPYQHVRKGVAYPAVLMQTGANDGRVNPMQSRKFTAALQAATASAAPVLLEMSKTAGHGIGSSLDDRVAQTVDALSFLYQQLGMGVPRS